MKRHMMLGVVASALFASAAAAEVAVSDMKIEDGAVAMSLSGAPGNPEEGRKIYESRALGNCVACHVISSSSAAFQGNVGPALDGVADRWEEPQLRAIVANAKMVFEGTIMPAFYKTGPYVRPGDAFTGKAPAGDLPPLLSAQQIEDVVAYLLTLKE